jgi:hypothetical protein
VIIIHVKMEDYVKNLMIGTTTHVHVLQAGQEETVIHHLILVIYLLVSIMVHVTGTVIQAISLTAPAKMVKINGTYPLKPRVYSVAPLLSCCKENNTPGNHPLLI